MTSRLLLWSARRSPTRGGRTALAATTVLAGGLVTLPVACSSGPADPAGPDAGRHHSVSAVAASRPALTGDVDGDGRDDSVTLGADGTLSVRLAGGEQPAPVDVGLGMRLLGLADVGEPGLAVVLRHGQRRGPTRVVALGDGGLVRLRTADRASLAASRHQAVWLDGSRRLLTGAVGSPGARRTAVYAQRWQVGPAGLAASSAGELCWDRHRDAEPRPCARGDDYGPDVGSAAGLPALFPAAEGSVGLGEPVTLPDGSTARLRGRARPEEAAGDVRLVLDRGGRRLEAPVPAGWSPTLLTQPVAGDHRGPEGGTGLVVSQEGGDSDTWTVYVRDAGRLLPVTVEGGIRLGGGFTADGGHARLSWLTPRGEMFTRVGLDREHHFTVYAWTLTGTVLRAHDLGEVCLDLQAQPPDYGRC